MKKTLRRLFIGLFSIVLFIGCVKEDNDDSNLEIISCNGTISIEGLNTNGFEVQSILERANLSNNGFNVKVFDSDIPQYLMVVNQNGDPVMLYRDVVSDDDRIVINAQTTAIAALTFHPALGTAVGNDYHQLVNIITSTQHFSEYLTAVESSIAANRNIYDTTNLQLLNAAKSVFAELMGDTTRLFGGFENVATKGTSPLTELYGCWPIDVRADQNKLKFRLPGCSPSYWCKVYDENSELTGEEFILPTRSNYGVLNVVECLMGKSDWLYGDEVTYTFDRNNQERFFHFDRSGFEGESNKYMHLANCILQMLGVKFNNDQITQVSIMLGQCISASEGADGWDALMTLVPSIIDATLNWLSNPSSNSYAANFVGYHAINITKALKWVNLLEGGGNLLLRTIWNFVSEDEYVFCSRYSSDSSKFGICLDPEQRCLMEIYNNTNGNNWLNNTNWGTSEPLSEWYGVITNENGNVISVNLDGNNLNGNSCFIDISCLHFLETIDLSNNILTNCSIRYYGEFANIILNNTISNSVEINGFKNIVINGCKSGISEIRSNSQKIIVSNCNFGNLHTPFSSVHADSVIIDNCVMHSCGVSSAYLLFRNSTTNDTWFCHTNQKLIIDNSYCSTICGGDFNDNTIISLNNATLWRSNWDDESLETFTCTILGSQWYSLFE